MRKKRKYNRKSTGSPPGNDSVRDNEEAMPLKDETVCQLPHLIQISNDCYIKDIDFIRAMRISSKPFIPLRLRTKPFMGDIYSKPTKDDIDSPRL
jgi:hypothetical protein